MGNADSATNLMWLMNQADGDLGAKPAASAAKKAEEAPPAAGSGLFSDFKVLVEEKTP